MSRTSYRVGVLRGEYRVNYISATPPPNIMTAARGHRKPSRARANVKGGEIASVLPGEYRVLSFST